MIQSCLNLYYGSGFGRLWLLLLARTNLRRNKVQNSSLKRFLYFNIRHQIGPTYPVTFKFQYRLLPISPPARVPPPLASRLDFKTILEAKLSL